MQCVVEVVGADDGDGFAVGAGVGEGAAFEALDAVALYHVEGAVVAACRREVVFAGVADEQLAVDLDALAGLQVVDTVDFGYCQHRCMGFVRDFFLRCGIPRVFMDRLLRQKGRRKAAFWPQMSRL